MYRKFIGTTNFILPPDRWQKVKIVLSTENLQAFVEGEEVINVDLSQVDFPKTGYVGLLGFRMLPSEIQYLKINGHEEVSDSGEFRGSKKRTPPSSAPPVTVTPLVPLTNAGFEVFPLGEGQFTRTVALGNPDEIVTADPIPGWTVSSSTAGSFNPSTSSYPGEAPEGQNVAWSAFGTISQVVSSVLRANTRYTLTVEVGNRMEQPFPGYRVELYAGSGFLAADTSTVSSPHGTFRTSTVTVDIGAVHPRLGQFLEIRLRSEGQQTNFDDVRLNATSFVPLPSSPLTNAGHEEVSDSDEFRGSKERTPPRVEAKTPPLVEPLYKRTPKGYEQIIGPAHEEISDSDEFRGSRKQTPPRVETKTPPPVEPLYKRTPKGYERIIGPSVAQQSSYAGMYVYPKHGQSAYLQSQDAGQCVRFAVEVTGYNPARPPAATRAKNSLGDQGRTLAKGAVVGAAANSAIGAAAGAAMGGPVGAVAGALTGAAGGAVAGLLGGSVVARRNQQAKTHQDQAAHAAHRQEYVRAFSACMDARGYSVR
jgi:hypothetical protein